MSSNTKSPAQPGAPSAQGWGARWHSHVGVNTCQLGIFFSLRDCARRSSAHPVFVHMHLCMLERMQGQTLPACIADYLDNIRTGDICGEAPSDVKDSN